LGQFDAKEGLWQVVSEDSGVSISSKNKDHNIVNINGMVVDGQLSFSVVTQLGQDITNKLRQLLVCNIKKVIKACLRKVRKITAGKGRELFTKIFGKVQNDGLFYMYAYEIWRVKPISMKYMTLLQHEKKQVYEIIRRMQDDVLSMSNYLGVPKDMILACNESGSKPPILWICNNWTEFHNLASTLSAEQPIFGMRSLNQYVKDIGSTYNMIEHFCLIYFSKLVSLIDVTKPFILFGNCQSGIFAESIAIHFHRVINVDPCLVTLEYVPTEYMGNTLMMFGRESQFNPFYNTDIDPNSIWVDHFRGAYKWRILPSNHGGYFSGDCLAITTKYLLESIDILDDKLNTNIFDKKLIIHMGQHKTGSTAIQKSLLKHCDDNEILYPKTGLYSMAHYAMAHILSNSEESEYLSFKTTLFDEIRSSNTKTVVISNENFSSDKEVFFDQHKMELLWNRLKDIADNFNESEIVFYVREQAESIESRINQSIKSKICTNIKDMGTIINNVTSNPTLDYNWFYDRLRLIFPYSKITPLVYDSEILYSNDIVSDFFKKILGLEIAGSNYNPRIAGLDLVKKCMYVNSMSISIESKMNLKAKLISSSNGLSDSQTILNQQIVDQIREKYKESNLIFNKKSNLCPFRNSFVAAGNGLVRINQDEFIKFKKKIIEDYKVVEDFIPKIITQYWSYGDIPSEVQDIMQSWIDHNPSYRHIVFNKSQAIEFIEKEYGQEVKALFLECTLPAMESDFFRLAYILKYGGIYADARLKSSADISALICEGSKVYFLQRDIGVIRNGFIVAKPQHYVIKFIFESMISNMKSKYFESIWDTTGPGNINNVVQSLSYINRRDVVLLDEAEMKSSYFELQSCNYNKSEKHWSKKQLTMDSIFVSGKCPKLSSKNIYLKLATADDDLSQLRESFYIPEFMYATDFHHNQIIDLFISRENIYIYNKFIENFKELYNQISSAELDSIMLIFDESIFKTSISNPTFYWNLNLLMKPFKKRFIISDNLDLELKQLTDINLLEVDKLSQ
ncbi:glycosyltransferase, partial [Francisella philomiragia]